MYTSLYTFLFEVNTMMGIRWSEYNDVLYVCKSQAHWWTHRFCLCMSDGHTNVWCE